MKIPKIANAVGHLEGDLVSAAADETKKKKKVHWGKWGALAACFAALIVASAVILPPLFGGGEEDRGGSAESGSRYKDVQIQPGEAYLLWPWDYRTAYEKYTGAEIDGSLYRGRGREVSEALVGERMGVCTVNGHDENDKRHTAEAEVYALRNASPEQFVAVRLEGRYYVFQNNTYAPPGRFGELLEAVNLPKAVELNRFSENGNGQTFALKDDGPVWEILSGCGDAVFVEEENWSVIGRSYLSFSAASETLGAYKVAYITEDGYLWTNLFEWGYLFRIGEDAAGEIIRYAKAHSAEVAYEPYQKSVAGTVAEITGEYLLIDDSILCVDPGDGITYRVPLWDLRISRYVDLGVIRQGDTVQVTYEGEIDTENGNVISGAVSVDKAVISGGDVMIPE